MVWPDIKKCPFQEVAVQANGFVLCPPFDCGPQCPSDSRAPDTGPAGHSAAHGRTVALSLVPLGFGCLEATLGAYRGGACSLTRGSLPASPRVIRPLQKKPRLVASQRSFGFSKTWA